MATLTLTELCALIGDALDDHLAGSFWVKAEVNSLSRKNGHLYLELIDGNTAKMRATCWSGTQELLMAYFEAETGQTLQPGMAVLVEAEIKWHASSVSILRTPSVTSRGNASRPSPDCKRTV